jgi:hypothetical protein
MLSLGLVFSEPPLCAGFTACAGTAALIPGTRAAGWASSLLRVPLLACLQGSRLEPLTELNLPSSCSAALCFQATHWTGPCDGTVLSLSMTTSITTRTLAFHSQSTQLEYEPGIIHCAATTKGALYNIYARCCCAFWVIRLGFFEALAVHPI